jgi:hypothetical protein
MVVIRVHHNKRMGKDDFSAFLSVLLKNILEHEFHVVQVMNIIKQYHQMVIITMLSEWNKNSRFLFPSFFFRIEINGQDE